MCISGAESLVATASPFIGQGESAMLIKPFVEHLTQAELHQIMCSGFATIAGSVLIAYISLGVNAQALVSSCKLIRATRFSRGFDHPDLNNLRTNADSWA